MKSLLTMVAAIAITSAVSAQTECTFTTTECGTITKSFDVATRTVRTPTGVNITDRATGEVLDTFECEGNIRVQCASLRSSNTPIAPRTPFVFPRRPRTTPVPTTTSTPEPTTSAPAPTTTTRSPRSGGFSPTSAIGLGNNGGIGGN